MRVAVVLPADNHHHSVAARYFAPLPAAAFSVPSNPGQIAHPRLCVGFMRGQQQPLAASGQLSEIAGHAVGFRGKPHARSGVPGIFGQTG